LIPICIDGGRVERNDGLVVRRSLHLVVVLRRRYGGGGRSNTRHHHDGDDYDLSHLWMNGVGEVPLVLVVGDWVTLALSVGDGGLLEKVQSGVGVEEIMMKLDCASIM
jgi:hypothetical protein